MNVQRGIGREFLPLDRPPVERPRSRQVAFLDGLVADRPSGLVAFADGSRCEVVDPGLDAFRRRGPEVGHAEEPFEVLKAAAVPLARRGFHCLHGLVEVLVQGQDPRRDVERRLDLGPLRKPSLRRVVGPVAFRHADDPLLGEDTRSRRCVRKGEKIGVGQKDTALREESLDLGSVQRARTARTKRPGADPPLVPLDVGEPLLRATRVVPVLGDEPSVELPSKSLNLHRGKLVRRRALRLRQRGEPSPLAVDLGGHGQELALGLGWDFGLKRDLDNRLADVWPEGVRHAAAEPEHSRLRMLVRRRHAEDHMYHRCVSPGVFQVLES